MADEAVEGDERCATCNHLEVTHTALKVPRGDCDRAGCSCQRYMPHG